MTPTTDMGDLDTREWLLTNGLGSFASGTICDAHTRTYHGWLVAALDPPGRRTLLLARIDATLEVLGQPIELSTNYWQGGAIAPQGYQFLQSFEVEPVPTWVWGEGHWQLCRRIVMPYGLLEADYGSGHPQFDNRVLIHYRYEGRAEAVLKLRPLIGDRDFHHQQTESSDLHFSQVIESQRLLLQAGRQQWLGTPWQLHWTQGSYCPSGVWYWHYHYPEETQRGLGNIEDLYSPGYLEISLQPGDTLTLEARVGMPDTAYCYPPLDAKTFDRMLEFEHQRLASHYTQLSNAATGSHCLWAALIQAGDRCIAYRASIDGPTVIAGYHWFNDWGRDTLIALPGLALATKRFALARGLLKTFGRYCQDGLIPNAFPDAGAKPFYNSLDAALWWVETLGIYVDMTQDWAFLKQQYPIVRKIYKGLTAGTLYNIRVDALDGLVTWDAEGVALTWMDAVVNGKPITPRRGKAVEINALWYSALCWATQWAEHLQHEPGMDANRLAVEAQLYAQQSRRVRASLRKFWNPATGYFYDTIQPDDSPDGSIRPNAVIALSLSHNGFAVQHGCRVLEVARDRLLTPYGLRSLDPADSRYIGLYSGGGWQRDCAYHQGTVWSWLLGPFIRAWRRFQPNQPLPIDWQPLLHHLQHEAGLGAVSEIFDGDAPHHPRGAIAQAWSVAELIRHWGEIEPFV